MSLFRRVSDNIRANLNSLLDKAEDPEKMLAQYLRDMEEDIAEAEGAVAKQLAVAWKFKGQLEEALALVEKREAQVLATVNSSSTRKGKIYTIIFSLVDLTLVV